MGAFRTLGLTFLLFAVTFVYLGGWILNVGISGTMPGAGGELASMEVKLLDNWDAAAQKPEDQQSKAELGVIGTGSITLNGFSVTLPGGPYDANAMLTADGQTSLATRIDYSSYVTLPWGTSPTSTRQGSANSFQAIIDSTDSANRESEKLMYVFDEYQGATAAPAEGAPDRDQVKSDSEVVYDYISTRGNLAFQGKTSARVAVTCLSWAVLAALAAVTIEAFAYLNWIKLGDIWRVPLLAFFAMFLFLLASLVLIGVEDGARKLVNESFCAYPETFIESDWYQDIYKGETGDRCSVSFKPSVPHVTVFLAFTFAAFGFIFFVIAKVKQEWSADSSKDTSA